MTAFYILAFVAGCGLVLGVNLLFADLERTRRSRMQEQIEQEQRMVQRERAEVAVANRELYELEAIRSSEVGGGRRTLRERLELLIEQSGVDPKPSHFVIAAVVSGGGLYLLTTNYWIAVAGGIAGGLAPCLYLIWMRQRRMHRMLHQLPDTFDLISRMMQAGRTFPQALQTAASDSAAPLSTELQYCVDQQQLGMSPDAAMRDLARRNNLLEIRIFVLAVSIHRQTGGNLSVLLENLADVIRDRLQIHGLVSSVTGEARLQAYTLTVLPFVALLALSLIRREHAQELFDRPWLLVACACSMVAGWIWMRRILNFTF